MLPARVLLPGGLALLLVVLLALTSTPPAPLTLSEVRAAIEALRREPPPARPPAGRRRAVSKVGPGPPITKGGPAAPYPVRLARALGNRHVTHGFTRQRYAFEHDGGNYDAFDTSSHSRHLNVGGGDGGTLTPTNTVPLKLKVNVDALSEATARPYTTCFNVGDWYYTGPENPASAGPPPSGTPTCADTSGSMVAALSAEPCWGKCQADDVLTPELVAFFRTSLDAAVSRLERAIRVPKLADSSSGITLSRSTGTYQTLYRDQWGWDTSTPTCAADTLYMCGAKAPADYCDESGTLSSDGNNAVLFITYMPVLWGGGTGASCETDQLGRPITLVYNLRVSLRKYKRDMETAWAGHTSTDEYARVLDTAFVGLSIHEILHGLGFSIGMFEDHQLVALHDSYATPAKTGTKDDALWFFKPATRTSQIAKTHFACDDDSKWQGLPLMGAAESGRDSHHNSFVLLEAVESYGTDDKLTVFDLSPLEDMGLYLANYSECDFPDYGAYQGCDFVSTRCRTRKTSFADHEMYTVVNAGNAAAECGKRFTPLQSFEGRCAPLPSCAPTSETPPRCPAECIALTADNADAYRALRPVMNGTAAALGSVRRADGVAEKGGGGGGGGYAESGLLGTVSAIATSLTLSIVASVVMQKCCGAGEKRMVTLSHSISALFILLGLAVTGVAVYLLALATGTLAGLPFLSPVGCVALLAFGIAILLQGGMQYKAAMGTGKLAYYGSGVIAVVFIILQISIALALLVYIGSLSQVQATAASGGRWGNAGYASAALQEIDNYICESYRNCCTDPDLFSGTKNVTFYTKDASNTTTSQWELVNASGVCLHTHEGQSLATSALYDLTDPARPRFCEYISGTPSSKHDHFKGIAPSTCGALSSVVDGFEQATCQASFCHDGVEGYNKFVTIMVAAIERNGVLMGVVLLVALLVQVIQLHVLHNLHRTHVHDAARYGATKEGKKGSGVQQQQQQQQPYVTVEVAAQPPRGDGSQSPYVVAS